MKKIPTTIKWSGRIPGYGAVSREGWAISVPNEQAIVFANGSRIVLLEVANWIALSDGGRWAWQGHESGLIYQGLESTGIKGFGQHSIVYVGEELRILSTVEEYQATIGGWAYVDEAGEIVSYGSKYSGPPLWERTDYHDISIGQGPENDDGVCVHVPGESFIRRLESGDFFNIRVSRSGDAFQILGVNYPLGFTRVWSVTLEELRALPAVSPAPLPAPAPVPVPVPVPEVTPVAVPNRAAELEAFHHEWNGGAPITDEAEKHRFTAAFMARLNDRDKSGRWGRKSRAGAGQPVSKDTAGYWLGASVPVEPTDGRIHAFDLISGATGAVSWNTAAEQGDPLYANIEARWYPVPASSVPDPGPIIPKSGTAITIDLAPALAGLVAEIKAIKADNADLRAAVEALKAAQGAQAHTSALVDGAVVALKAHGNGTYVTADPSNGEVTATARPFGEWQLFTIEAQR